MPDTPPPTLIGPVLLTVLTLLGAYLLILRIRDHLAEKPDPKLTYATRGELDRTRESITQTQHANKNDLDAYRSEHKADHAELERRIAADIHAAHDLIHKNAQHIATLIAHNQSLHQRLNELTVKTDRLLERSHPAS